MHCKFKIKYLFANTKIGKLAVKSTRMKYRENIIHNVVTYIHHLQFERHSKNNTHTIIIFYDIEQELEYPSP